MPIFLNQGCQKIYIEKVCGVRIIPLHCPHHFNILVFKSIMKFRNHSIKNRKIQRNFEIFTCCGHFSGPCRFENYGILKPFWYCPLMLRPLVTDGSDGRHFDVGLGGHILNLFIQFFPFLITPKLL